MQIAITHIKTDHAKIAIENAKIARSYGLALRDPREPELGWRSIETTQVPR